MALTRLTRLGNSLGVVVPAATLREMGWWQGDVVKQSIEDGRLVLQNLTQAKVRPAHNRVEFGDGKHSGA